MSPKTYLVVLCAALIWPFQGMADQGEDGTLNIIYWQAPSILNPYLSGGIKEIEAASLILEPLARYDQTGALVPWLAEAIPTLENGGVTEDLRRITWVLRDGLTWSDGTPVTSEDVKFTHTYCTAEGGGCASAQKFSGIESIETPDTRTVEITFEAPTPFPYNAFVGAGAPILSAAQFSDCVGAAAPGCAEQNFAPIGTGPFTVAEFRPNDVVVYEANPNYREPNKPAFARVLLKGGGDVETAARAVLVTGEFDYAWNLQMAPDILRDMQAQGGGEVVSAFGTLVERVVFNLTDPDPVHGEARSTILHPHPALGDINVRNAMSLAIDRALLVEIGYGAAGRVTCNILPAPAIYASIANDACKVQDIEGAKALLDAAGWLQGQDGIRSKDGARLSFTFQTATNAVRQDFQVILKQWWQEIGIEVELRNHDGAVFFGSDPSSPHTYQKFFADIQMFANTFDGTDPEAYLASWTCGRIPSPDNQWQGSNVTRFCSDEYDALVAQMRETGDLEERARLARQMNDMLIQSFAILPLVDRGRISGHVGSLGGIVMNTWDSELWNIADWYRKDD